MATSIPIKDLKSTGKVLELCESEADPVLVTKNGYPAFYLVKPQEMDALRASAAERELYSLVDHSLAQIARGELADAREGLAQMKERYGL